jgi:hypothetical protein
LKNLIKKKQIFGVLFLFPFLLFGQKSYENKYQWQIPGGRYVDPTSFFSLHGYVNAVYGSSSKEWKNGNFNGLGMPGQVILPNTNKASFTNDAALWVGSDINPYSSLLMEIHLVTSPSGVGASGPGGLTLVLTEANAKIKLYKSLANISIGTFWSTFGIQNEDWLGAQNLFSTIPLASGAYLTHYNEKGLRLDGYISKNKYGLNYVLSYGNGYNAWDISGYNSFDLNENKALNGRIAIFPGFEDKLQLGLSIGTGTINESDLDSNSLNKSDYDHSFLALGADLTALFNGFKFRTYLIQSEEELQNSKQRITLHNLGLMSELSYKFKFKNNKKIESIDPKFRFDYLNKKQKEFEPSDTFINYSFGANFQLNSSFVVSLDYNFLTEKENKIDNDRFVVRVSANF